MKLFIAALESLINNFVTAVKISIVPFLIGAGLLYGSIFVLGIGDLVNVDGQIPFEALAQNGMGIALIVLVVVIIALVSLMIFSVVAISWHRAVLERQPVSFLPRLKGMPVDRYVGRLILVGLILIAIGFAVAFVWALLSSLLLPLGRFGLILVSVLGLIIFGFMTGVWYRIASTLPAIALGERPKVGLGWEQTDEIGFEIYGAAILMLVLSFLLGLLEIPFRFSPALSFTISIAQNWLTTMLGLSILTEIYRRTGFRPNTAEIFE